MKKRTRRSLTKLADAAFRQAARDVIQRAEETGTPVIVWENETITKLAPGKLKSRRKAPTKRAR